LVTRKALSLEDRYHDDLTLLKFYQKKLIYPGWAGELDRLELDYIRKSLMSDRRLRATWGFKRGTGRLSEEKIREVALFGVDGLQDSSFEALESSVQLRVKNAKGPA